MSQTAPPIPPGFHTLSPHIVVDGAADAIDFYQRAFGAEEIERHVTPGAGSVMHATMRIGDAMLMLNDEFPDWGVVGPSKLGGTAVTLHLYVEDADTVFQQAVAAGATPVMEMDDTFWGDRFGKVSDPFGHHWSIATRQRHLTAAEVEKAAAAAFAPSTDD